MLNTTSARVTAPKTIYHSIVRSCSTYSEASQLKLEPSLDTLGASGGDGGGGGVWGTTGSSGGSAGGSSGFWVGWGWSERAGLLDAFSCCGVATLFASSCSAGAASAGAPTCPVGGSTGPGGGVVGGSAGGGVGGGGSAGGVGGAGT